MTGGEDEEPHGLQVSVGEITRARWAVVRVSGEIDVHNARGLRKRLRRLIEDDTRSVVVDLRCTTSIDSAGLGVLVAIHRAVHARGGELQVVVDQEHIVKVLRLTSLSRLLTIKRVAPHPGPGAVLGG